MGGGGRYGVGVLSCPPLSSGRGGAALMVDWLMAAGEGFGPERYLFWTRLQGSAWTVADYVIVFYLLRLGNLVRSVEGVRRHIFSFFVIHRSDE